MNCVECDRFDNRNQLCRMRAAGAWLRLAGLNDDEDEEVPALQRVTTSTSTSEKKKRKNEEESTPIEFGKLRTTNLLAWRREIDTAFNSMPATKPSRNWPMALRQYFHTLLESLVTRSPDPLYAVQLHPGIIVHTNKSAAFAKRNEGHGSVLYDMFSLGNIPGTSHLYFMRNVNYDGLVAETADVEPKRHSRTRQWYNAHDLVGLLFDTGVVTSIVIVASIVNVRSLKVVQGPYVRSFDARPTHTVDYPRELDRKSHEQLAEEMYANMPDEYEDDGFIVNDLDSDFDSQEESGQARATTNDDDGSTSSQDEDYVSGDEEEEDDDEETSDEESSNSRRLREEEEQKVANLFKFPDKNRDDDDDDDSESQSSAVEESTEISKNEKKAILKKLRKSKKVLRTIERRRQEAEEKERLQREATEALLKRLAEQDRELERLRHQQQQAAPKPIERKF